MLFGHRHQSWHAKDTQQNTKHGYFHLHNIAVSQTLWCPEMGGPCIKPAIISTGQNQNV